MMQIPQSAHGTKVECGRCDSVIDTSAPADEVTAAAVVESVTAASAAETDSVKLPASVQLPREGGETSSDSTAKAAPPGKRRSGRHASDRLNGKRPVGDDLFDLIPEVAAPTDPNAGLESIPILPKVDAVSTATDPDDVLVKNRRRVLSQDGQLEQAAQGLRMHGRALMVGLPALLVLMFSDWLIPLTGLTAGSLSHTVAITGLWVLVGGCGLAGLFGQLLCLSTPRDARARGPLAVSMCSEVVLITLLTLPLTLPPHSWSVSMVMLLLGFTFLLGLSRCVSFGLFLKRIAEFSELSGYLGRIEFVLWGAPVSILAGPILTAVIDPTLDAALGGGLLSTIAGIAGSTITVALAIAVLSAYLSTVFGLATDLSGSGDR